MRSRKTTRLLFILPFMLLFSSCDEWSNVPTFEVETVEGYRPIYAPAGESSVQLLDPQSIENPGKIYVIEDYLLLVDRLKGVHIFDNTDPRNPIQNGFLKVLGSNDVAVRDNVLYVDQASDLLAIDISNPANPTLTSRVKGVFPFGSQYPPFEGFYFECPDPNQGLVVGWEIATLQSPKCYR